MFNNNHIDAQITNSGEDVGKIEPSYSVGRNVNWCSYYGEQYGGFSENYSRSAIWDSNSTPGYISEKKQKHLIWKLYAPQC